MKKVMVAGGGGFIGGHLIAALRGSGVEIRAIDVKPLDEWHQLFPDVDNIGDSNLEDIDECMDAVEGISEIYNLAASMGGMGFIEANKALCMLNVLINTHLLVAAREAEVERYFFSSSACVYAQDRQRNPNVMGLRESDAYPADPEDGYGEEKLFSEAMCRHFFEDFGLETRVARFHNIYGPYGTWDGGREKAPAAICRKVAKAKITGEHVIEIWGDGTQTRSFCYITDCIKGIQAIMEAPYHPPLNLGSAEKVSINQLVEIVESIAGIKCERKYLLNAPKGVNGRNSDNTKFKKAFGWEPSTPLVQGLRETYTWIYAEVLKESMV